MNFIKKRLFLIACCTSFLVGIGLFVPAMMINAKNLEEFKKIESEYNKVSSLDRNKVHDNVLGQLQKNLEKAKQEAQKVVRLAQQTSARPLIDRQEDKNPPVLTNVFPKPVTDAGKIIYYQDFGKAYCRLVDQFITSIRGGGKPSEADEDSVINEYRRRSGAGTVGTFSRSSSMRLGGRGGLSRGDTPEAKLINDLRRSRSNDISIYVNPLSFCCYDYWKNHDGNGEDEVMLKDSWFTQIAAWIQEDVLIAVNQLNNPGATVLENPIKRLIEISFGGNPAGGGASQMYSSSRSSTSAVRYGGASVSVGRRQSGSEKALPCYVIRRADARSSLESVQGKLTDPYNARVSDEMVEIVHFDLGVIIDTGRIIDFINALQSTMTSPNGASPNQRNQISVLDIQVEPVLIDQEQDAGYYYGAGSLGVLRLVCEYDFYKSGYQQYQPEPVKDLFKPPEAPPGPGYGAAGVYGGR